MSNQRKIIQINPELFKMGGNKSRKNREVKEKREKPIVTPNNLKSKLLKRIKEHKNNEINEKSSLDKNNNISNTTNQKTQSKPDNYNDEFYGAIDYLSQLSNKKKTDSDKTNIINKRAAIHNKTIKSRIINNLANVSPSPHVGLNLPPELQETNTYFSPDKTVSTMRINYEKKVDPPYGVLKNGTKPTYKSWIQTRRNYDHQEIENVSAIRPPTPPKRNEFMDQPIDVAHVEPTIAHVEPTIMSREQRLEQIKNKLARMEVTNNDSQNTKLASNLNNISNETIIELDNLDELNENVNISIPEIFKEKKQLELKYPKKFLKKTIRRKFTLGRSNKFKTVGVLIKDKHTRKRIIDSQKELKRTSITDVRKYLRQHGMVKVGSTAPLDVLRKTFESSMLAGEITNTNNDTLLHNFLHEDKNLEH